MLRKILIVRETYIAEKMYELIVWFGDNGERQKLGVYSETYCRAYCRQFAGKGDLHIQCNEVKN